MLAAGLVLTACTGNEGPGALDRVRAIVLPYFTLMPFHIAAEEGFFRDEGLDVEFTRLTRNADIMTALARGDVDVAGGMLTANELNLAANGARVRMVAGLGELRPGECPFMAMMARPEIAESGALDDPERIRQLRFDIDVTLPLGYWADLVLADFGLSLEDVETVSVTPPATLGALANHTIDVTFDSVPFITMIENAGEGVIWRSMGPVTPGYSVSVLMYGPRLLDEDRDVGERFAVAMLRAIRQYGLGKTPRNVEIVERATGLDEEIVREACWPVMNESGALYPDVFRPYQQWSVDHGLLDRVVDDGDLFDPRFMEHANAVLDH